MPKKISATNQFRIGMGCILLLFSIGFAVFEYLSLKNMVNETIYRETEIFITTVESTRTYVKDVTRPILTDLLHPDGFIPEVMSTSYVGREIMGRVHRQFPHFFYKRAARNPMNPVNQADSFENEMIDWFARNGGTSQWSGIISKGNRSYFARSKAIYAETECLVCHGDPSDAPQEMKSIYGTAGGYGYRAGDVVAADTVYIPVDVAFVRIKEKAFWVFLIGIGSLFMLFSLFYLLFNRTVVSQLKGLLDTFRSIPGDNPVSTERIPIRSGGEVEQLKEAFEQAAVSLRQAHEELKASESKYRRLFETSQDPIFICDMDKRLTDINGAGLRLFGFENRPEALAMESFYQLFWDARDAETFWQSIHDQGSVKEHEAAMVDVSGHRIEAVITANRHLDENDQPAGFEGIIRDITEKRRIDKYLAQTEKLASIGQLAAGVAHEINNPLGVIQCYAGLIKKCTQPESQVCEDIKIIEKHTQNCKGVVEALLSFARVSSPMKTRTDIHDTIDEVLTVLDRLMQKHEIRVQRHYHPDLAPVTVDTQKMKQVFMNLLLNAQQAIGDHGDISVITGMDEPTGMIAVEIRDSGCGIAEKNIDKIFEPFFTTKADGKGTGLGLAVTYGIVKQHEGDIQVASKPGQGSTFKVLLPPAAASGPAGSPRNFQQK